MGYFNGNVLLLQQEPLVGGKSQDLVGFYTQKNPKIRGLLYFSKLLILFFLIRAEFAQKIN